MQPQEAINCSKDQLGPSRCSWPPALVLPHLGVCDGASPSLSWGDDGCFHLLSNLKGRLSQRRRPPKPLYCALFWPPPTKCKSLERTITSSWSSSAFYRWGEIREDLSHVRVPRAPPLLYTGTPQILLLFSHPVRAETGQSKSKSITAEVQGELSTIAGSCICEENKVILRILTVLKKYFIGDKFVCIYHVQWNIPTTVAFLCILWTSWKH